MRYGDFIKNIIDQIWDFLFAIEFTVDGSPQVSFGSLFCFSLLFIVGLRVIAAVVNSYSKYDD